MFKLPALALASVMALTSAAQVHPIPDFARTSGISVGAAAPLEDGPETLQIYYTPLASTEVSRFVGFGTAYHMAIVYTDAGGRSFGVSSGPSDLAARPSPSHALSALMSMASDAPSAFGTLVADPHNNTRFTIGDRGDDYTRDGQHHAYPHSLVIQGRNLSAQWATIVSTYARVGRLNLTYSPISQNSNSMAATALRRAGLTLQFSSNTWFTPGTFTQLPEG